MSIFNYYVENSTAAFPANALPEQFYTMLMKKAEGYISYTLIDIENDSIAGFCQLSPYSPFSTFAGEMRKFSRSSAESSEKISDKLNKIKNLLIDIKEDVSLSNNMVSEQINCVDELNKIFDKINNEAKDTIEICKNNTRF